MSLRNLREEIDGDPLGRGYSGMTDEQIAASLNDTIDVNVNRDRMTGSEVFDEVDSGEFNALAGDVKQQVLGLCAIDSLDPFGVGASIIADVFPGGGVTITALQAARTLTVSQAEALGLGLVEIAHVTAAKAAVFS